MDSHLSISGALTGDMFIAAVLDVFPQHEESVVAAIDAVDAAHPVACALLAHRHVEMSGRRFEIVPFERYFGHIPFAFSREAVRWSEIEEGLRAAEIKQGIRRHAGKLFELVAKAGAARRTKDAAELTPWYVTSQVVGAAALIDALGPVGWTVSSFPARTTVTLTAAAILDYLCPPRTRSTPLPRMRSLARSGIGFGSPPAANTYLRLLCFDEGSAAITSSDISAQVPPASGRTGRRSAQ
jgi:pyridinium-3,5-bisthiocarboxylic acid mononucleotide nickel chelatase